jgi:hypothetical protein
LIVLYRDAARQWEAAGDFFVSKCGGENLAKPRDEAQKQNSGTELNGATNA